MSSHAFASLLAMPSALRRVLLQTALAGNFPSSALIPPTVLSPPQARSFSKRTTPSRSSKTAKSSRSSPSTKPKRSPASSPKKSPASSLKSVKAKSPSPKTAKPSPTSLSSSKVSNTSHKTAKPSSPSLLAGDSEPPTGLPQALSFLPTPAHTSPTRATPADPPSPSDLARVSSLVQSPKFLYSAPRFLHLPINTRMPEVCLLGRSNVGKSTLINAIAGLGGRKAGTAHGSTNVRKGLAITSARAGCTKTMNAYGFGPPLRVRPLSKEQQAARKEGGRARSERRASGVSNKRGAIKPEGPPMHSLVMMDMPGYGLNSRADWGEEILKYLSRREMLHGAVLLIDAVAGVKPGDRTVLEVLRDAGLKTSVVLTKADKLVTDLDPEVWRNSGLLRQACVHVWDEIRRIERQGEMDWFEGDGWTPEIFVTGAGDPKMGGMGVDGARLAISRLAGYVAEPKLKYEDALPEVVPYDQLVFAPAAPAPKYEVPPTEEAELQRKLHEGRGRTRPWRASKRVDQMKQMEAAIQRPARGRKLGQASF